MFIVPFPSVLPSTELALAAAALRCGVGGAQLAAHADPASRERERGGEQARLTRLTRQAAAGLVGLRTR